MITSRQTSSIAAGSRRGWTRRARPLWLLLCARAIRQSPESGSSFGPQFGDTAGDFVHRLPVAAGNRSRSGGVERIAAIRLFRDALQQVGRHQCGALCDGHGLHTFFLQLRQGDAGQCASVVVSGPFSSVRSLSRLGVQRQANRCEGVTAEQCQCLVSHHSKHDNQTGQPCQVGQFRPVFAGFQP